MSEEGNSNGKDWEPEGGTIEVQVQDDPFPLEIHLNHLQNLLKINVINVKDENNENVIFELKTSLRHGVI